MLNTYSSCQETPGILIVLVSPIRHLSKTVLNLTIIGIENQRFNDGAFPEPGSPKISLDIFSSFTLSGSPGLIVDFCCAIRCVKCDDLGHTGVCCTGETKDSAHRLKAEQTTEKRQKADSFITIRRIHSLRDSGVLLHDALKMIGLRLRFGV
ncbi:hypothetical protein ACHWQZ_G008226 [Mnemiopsis leidyi]